MPLSQTDKGGIFLRLRRNVGVSLISLIVVAACGFVTMFFNARALGVEGLGIYSAVLALSLMLEAIAGLQCWQAVIVLSENRESRIFGAALLVNVASASIASVVGVILLFFVAPTQGWAAIFLMATLALRLSEPFIGLLRKYDEFNYIAYVRSLLAGLGVLTAAVLWYTDAPIAYYLVAAALVQLVQPLALYARTRRLCAPARPTGSDVKEVLKFSTSSGISGALGAIRQRGLVILLSVIAGAGAVGLYTVADRIASVMQMAFRAIFEAVFREMPSLENPWKLIGTLGAGGAFLSVIAVLAAYLLGDWVIALAAGEDFRAAAPALTILVAAYCLSICTLGLRAWVITKIGPAAMLACNAFAILSLVLGIVLISTYASTGAAMTQVVFEILWLLAVGAVIYRHHAKSRTAKANNA